MASSRSQKEKRRWSSLSVDEIPGSFRRLNEDEARSPDWPPATLPLTKPSPSSSSVNGKGGKKQQQQQAGASASLRHPKREGKPSIFHALTWSKGKKSRPKIDLDPDRGNHVDDPKTSGDARSSSSSSLPPESSQQQKRDHSANSTARDYSERSVDVHAVQVSAGGGTVGDGGSGGSGPSRPRPISSSSSSSSSSGSSHGDVGFMETREKHQDRSKPPESSEETSSKPQHHQQHQQREEEQQTPNEKGEKKEGRYEIQQTPDSRLPTGCREERDAGASGEQQQARLDQEKGGGGKEASRGETYYDTGRRFRLEATVMVDDERPAERRVTYLGPVLLSPLNEKHGHYVHVTVAPGSATKADEGDSLLVRPAQPVLIRSSSSTADNGTDGAAAGPAKVKVKRLSQRAAETTAAPSPFPFSPSLTAAENNNDALGSPAGVNGLGLSSKPGPASPKAVEDVMEVSSSNAALVTASPPSGPLVAARVGQKASTWGMCETAKADGERSAELQDGEGVASFPSDVLAEGAGDDSLVVVRDSSQADPESAPSPIPVDQSVFGSPSAFPPGPPDVDRMMYPICPHEDVKGTPELIPPRPAYKRHRRNKSSSSSSSSSTSSLRTSSTSSADARKERKSYELEEDGRDVSDRQDTPADSTREEHHRDTKAETTTLKTGGYVQEQSESYIIAEKPIIADLERAEAAYQTEAFVTEPLPEAMDINEEQSMAEDGKKDKARRVDSFGRPLPNLLDPHLLLSEDGGHKMSPLKESSIDTENRCDVRMPSVEEIQSETGSVVSQPCVSLDVHSGPGTSFEPYVISVSEQSETQSLPDVTAEIVQSTHSIAAPAEGVDVETSQNILPLEVNRDLFHDTAKGPTMLESPPSRPQKSSRGSLAKKEVIEPSVAPEDAAIHQSSLPLPTVRRSSSSSSSSLSSSSSSSRSGDRENKSREPPVVLTATKGIPYSPPGNWEVVGDVKVDSSSENEKYGTPIDLDAKDMEHDTSSANSSQFVTDTSLAEQVDLLAFEEPEIKVTTIFPQDSNATDVSTAELVNVPNSEEPVIKVTTIYPQEAMLTSLSQTVAAPEDQSRASPHDTSGSKSGQSDSEKSSKSSKSDKSESRKPPVFMTPPPPPTKPVRTCGSQSDLSERSDLEHEVSRVPPKPARAVDRSSASASPASDGGQKKTQSFPPLPTPSSSSSEDESKPPIVPPRKEKPASGSTQQTDLPSARDTLTAAGIEEEEKHIVSVSTTLPCATERKLEEFTHSISASFVPLDNNEIYYKDVAPADKGLPDLNSSGTSSSSDQIKTSAPLEDKGRKKEKSKCSSHEKSEKSEDPAPPPVPPRQKLKGQKTAPSLNTSSSSSSSHGSKSSHDQISQTSSAPAIPKTTFDVASVCVLEGSDIAPKLPETQQPIAAKREKLQLPESSGDEVILPDKVVPEASQMLEAPNIEVKLPFKPRTPSPKVGKSRTPSPRVDIPRTPSPSINKPRTPSPKTIKPRTPSPPNVADSSRSAFRPVSSPVRIESMQYTDEDTPEVGSQSTIRRTVSMSSTTSATSHEDDKEKKGGRSRLRKYWPFRRKKRDKKNQSADGRESEDQARLSSPPSPIPVDQSTPTLARRASSACASDTLNQSKPTESDVSTMSESAHEHAEGKKPQKKNEKKKRLFSSSGSSDSKSKKNKKDKAKGKNKAEKESKETLDVSCSPDRSRSVTPIPEGKSREKIKKNKEKKTEKTAEEKTKKAKKEDKDSKSKSKDKSGEKTKELDTSTSSSTSSSSKNAKANQENDSSYDTGLLIEPPLTPPRIAAPLTEHAPLSSSSDLQQPRFDGEFQRMDEDIQAEAAVATEVASTATASRRRAPIVVVAIDLGTTHSGYAFSFSRDPASVYVMSRWAGQEPGLLNHKTLSALLLTPEARFHSFGLAARNHYLNLLPIEAKHWLYFERFKMTLHHCKELSRDTMVTAVNGKELPALTVFAHVLEFFATHALQQLSDQSGTEFRRQDVRWVVTVPAIWREPAKQLMRQAALAGGMFTKEDPSQLLIVLEPEAASIYCRRLRMHQLMPEVGSARPLQSPRRSADVTNNMPAVSNLTIDGSKSTDSLDCLSEPTLESKIKGTRYVVVDCGGGTVDITVHELSSSGQLIELHRATGGPHGSTGVDEEFEALLYSIFGEDFVAGYRRQFPVGWVNLMTDFESRKRGASPFKTTSFNVSLPFTFISEYRKQKGEVEHAVKRHGDPDVEWSLQGMLRLAPPAMRRLFASTLVSIRQAIGDVLNHPNTRDLRYLFLVGGFAESPLLQHEVRREFGHLLTVLIPQDVSLAVLRGAVLFGLDPKVVSVRCARLTYGVGILNRFDPARHPIQKRVHRDGVDWCTDIFDRFVGINQPVSMGASVTRRYAPARNGQLLIVLNIYSSVHPQPTFITDPGVKKCGTLYLDLRAPSGSTSPSTAVTVTHAQINRDCGGQSEGRDGLSEEKGDAAAAVEGQPREILTRMAFGDTEISVTALDVTSGREVKASADFLSG